MYIRYQYAHTKKSNLPYNIYSETLQSKSAAILPKPQCSDNWRHLMTHKSAFTDTKSTHIISIGSALINKYIVPFHIHNCVVEIKDFLSISN